jgi:hypothetical protein
MLEVAYHDRGIDAALLRHPFFTTVVSIIYLHEAKVKSVCDFTPISSLYLSTAIKTFSNAQHEM